MKINIENPNRLVNFVEKSLTSWKIEYIGRGEGSDIYYYNLIHKDNPNNSLHSPKMLAIHIEIHSETQRMYDPNDFIGVEWVKVRLIHPQKKDVHKFIRVEEFKDIRRVLNHIHDGARQLLQ